MDRRRLLVIGGIIAFVLLAAVGLGAFSGFGGGQSTSTFTDQLGEEVTIADFDDCMDWVMPVTTDGGNVVCTAPGDVTFTAPCDDVPEVNCANLEKQE